MKHSSLAEDSDRLRELASTFRLPTVASELVKRVTDGGYADVLPILTQVFELEREARQQRRVERLRRSSRLSAVKTFASFDARRLPYPLQQKIRQLETASFLEESMNVLAFGLPGTGKTHFACALGHALVEKGHSVLFVPTFQLVQNLLASKRDLELPKALRKLDTFDLLILDDIGYVQQTPDEIEVLFTLLAERYERRSTLITSNLVFSQWERIFKDPMTTAAAIDRLVHHSAILEFDVQSYRSQGPEKTSEAKTSVTSNTQTTKEVKAKNTTKKTTNT